MRYIIVIYDRQATDNHCVNAPQSMQHFRQWNFLQSLQIITDDYDCQPYFKSNTLLSWL